jgi:hypothetical protein
MNTEGTWKHYCQAEKCVMWIGKSEECSWCGEQEFEVDTDKESQNEPDEL